MPDITRIQIANEPERSYKDFPANREFKKRAEDDNPGSSADPIVENAKETGGIGWTEEGKTSLIPETTFTTNNDGQANIVSDVDFAELYETYADQSVLKGKVNGVDCSVEMEYDYDGGYYSIYMFGDGTTGVELGQGEFDKAGFYATRMPENETYTIEMYIDASIVHTINSKYISGGGSDLFVVTFDASDYNNPTCDRTFSEILSARESGKKICGYLKNIGYMTVRYDDEYTPVFGFVAISSYPFGGSFNDLDKYCATINENNVINYRYDHKSI